jgi:Flp pilus assembly pilin Flp
MNILHTLQQFSSTRAERGQGLAEYALGLAFIFVVVVVLLALFGSAVTALYQGAVTELLAAFQGI